MALHERITNQEGSIDEDVTVSSSSNIYIYSLDQSSVGFFKLGSPSAFASNPTIIGTPGVDSAGACLSIVAGTPIAEVKYNLSDYFADAVLVDITSLNSTLYKDETTLADDLTVNSIVNSSGEYVVPDEQYVTTVDGAGRQIFDTSGSFTIPWLESKAPYTGLLLGREFTITSDSPICDGGGVLLCEQVPDSHIEQLKDECRVIMSKYLQLMERLVGRDGRTRRFKRAAQRFYNRCLSLLDIPQQIYACPPDLSLEPECSAGTLPERELLSAIDKMFSKRIAGRSENTVDRVRNRSKRTFKRKIQELFPENLWMCPK